MVFTNIAIFFRLIQTFEMLVPKIFRYLKSIPSFIKLKAISVMKEHLLRLIDGTKFLDESYLFFYKKVNSLSVNLNQF